MPTACELIRRAGAFGVIVAGLAMASSTSTGLAQKGKGGGGGDGTSLTYTVSVADDATFPSGANVWSPCAGRTPEASGRDNVAYVVFFPRDPCSTLTTSTGAKLTDGLRIDVARNSAGAIYAVQVSGQDVVGSDGIAHRTDLIAIPGPAVTPSASGFTLHVHAVDVPLYRCNTHRIKNNSRCDQNVGTFSFDDMIYVPNS